MARTPTVASLLILSLLIVGGSYWYVKTYFLATTKNQNLPVQQSGPLCATTEVLPAIVDGISMEGILDPGSHVTYLSGAYSCGMSVKRGDAVVISIGNKLLVKRVIAIGGDHWTYSGGTLQVENEGVKNSLGAPYQLKSAVLERLVSQYPMVPTTSILALGNKVNGSLDSSVFGFFGLIDLRGKVDIGSNSIK